MINITIPKEVSFKLPEGKYRAEIESIKPISKQKIKGRHEGIRIRFKVEVPGMDHLECLAGRNFPLNLEHGSELRCFLTDVLGADFFTKRSNQVIDCEKELVGKTGEITLSHYQGPKFDSPMVRVEAFEKCNTISRPGGGGKS